MSKTITILLLTCQLLYSQSIFTDTLCFTSSHYRLDPSPSLNYKHLCTLGVDTLPTGERIIPIFYAQSFSSIGTTIDDLIILDSNDNFTAYDNFGSGPPVFLYSFNLSLHDTVLDIVNSGYLLRIENIDSITLLNGVKKRVFYDSVGTFSGGNIYTWIEDIGSLGGLNKTFFFSLEERHRIECIMDKNGIIYNKPNYTDCFQNLSIQDIFELPRIIVIPNPATSWIRIKSQEQIRDVQIINYLGQTELFIQISRNSEAIDISNLHEGIKSVIIRHYNGNQFVTKFIKK